MVKEASMETKVETYGTEVKLLAYTALDENSFDLDSLIGLGPINDGQVLVEWAGRLCYAMENKVGTNPKWIQERIKDGHESILEHSSATFFIKASRVLTHELVRHRIASYSQRSQRYVKENEPKYITPPDMDNTGLIEISKWPGGNAAMEGPYTLSKLHLFEYVMNVCWTAYSELLKQGIKPEIARYVLPGACETQIVTTMNFRELRYFIKLRTSKRALPEMQEVAGRVRDICKEIAPQVFEDL